MIISYNIVPDWGKERQEFVAGKTPEEVAAVLEDLTLYGESLPKSPESDVILPALMIEGGTDQSDYESINLTWDGKTVRRNPYREPSQLEEHQTA